MNNKTGLKSLWFGLWFGMALVVLVMFTAIILVRFAL